MNTNILNTNNTSALTYPFKVSLSKNKIAKFRKWKVKDRKAFKTVLKDGADERAIANVLVKNCLEEDIVLSPDELQYLMIEMRKESISDNIEWSYKCECDTNNTVVVQLDDINKPHLADYKDVTISGIQFKFGDILNKDMYEAAIGITDEFDEVVYLDLAFHIHQIGDNIDFGIEDILNYIDDMDVNDIDELIKNYSEMKFYTNKTKVFICESCEKESSFEFDTIPNFFPESWL